MVFILLGVKAAPPMLAALSPVKWYWASPPYMKKAILAQSETYNKYCVIYVFNEHKIQECLNNERYVYVKMNPNELDVVIFWNNKVYI